MKRRAAALLAVVLGSGIAHGQTAPLTLLEKYTGAAGRNGIEAAMVLPDGRLFVTTEDTPAHLVRFNTPKTDLTNNDVLTFPDDGNHAWAQSITYSEITGLLYVSFFAQGASSVIKVSSVNPETLAVVDVISDGSLGAKAGSIIAVGSYLYVAVAGLPCKVVKYSITDYSCITSAPLTDGVQRAAGMPHSILYDGSWIYVQAEASFARVNPGTLGSTIYLYDSDQRVATNTNAIAAGRLWLAFETASPYAQGSINAYDLANPSSRDRYWPIQYLDPGNLRYSMGSIWVCYVVRNGNAMTGSLAVVRVKPETGEWIRMTLPAGLGEPNGILTDGEYLYGVGFTSPFWVARLSPGSTLTPTPTPTATRTKRIPPGKLKKTPTATGGS